MSYFNSNSQFSAVNKDAVKSSTVSIAKSSTTIKQIVNKSPFTYGAKKITFSVKPRTHFWGPLIESKYNDSKMLVELIKKQLVNSWIKGKDFSFDDLYNQPISPVLALTLILLNKELFKTKVFDDFVGGPNDTTSQMFTPVVYAKSTSIVNSTTNEVEYGQTETYKKSLPPYYHIHHSYINYGTSPNDDETNSVYMNDGGNMDLTGEQLRALNYLRKEGVLKKIADLPYGVKSSDINILRDGYGYGAICIGTFLNIIKANKKLIPDVICGLLVSEDSGMTIGDAINGIEGWLNPGHVSSGLLDFEPIRKLGTFKALEIIEEIGTYFFLSLLGHTFKKNIHFSIPLSNSQRNIFEAGYLIGDAINDLVQYAKTIISQGLYKQKSFEVFSIYTPCVMTSDGQVSNSILEMGNYTKSFGDLTTFEDNPLTQALGVKTCIDDIEELDYLINPTNGYKTHDFINKNLANHLIDQLSQPFDDNYGYISSVDKKLIQNNMLMDQGIAPRTTDSSGSFIFDRSKCNPIYDNSEFNISTSSTFNITTDSKVTFTFLDSDGNSTDLATHCLDYLDDNYAVGTTGVSTSAGAISISIPYDSNVKISLVLDGISLSTGQQKILNQNLKKNTSITMNLTSTNTTSGTIAADGSSTMKLYSLTIKVQGFEILINNTKCIITVPTITINADSTPEVVFTVANSAEGWSLTTPTSSTKTATLSLSSAVECSYISLENNINSIIKYQTMKLFKDNNCTLEYYLYLIDSTDDGETKAKYITTFYDVYGLAVCRIILINSFCNSYSLSLAASKDRYRKFFNVFTGYIEDMVDIDVTNLK